MNELPGTSVLILGYAREGQSVHRYIRERFPHSKVGIADRNKVDSLYPGVTVYSGHSYLSAIDDYDVIVHSPGIPTHLPELELARSHGKWVTSATNIFFSVCPGTIIGITGTKGKSTTTALTWNIVKKGHADVRLVGNIGEPVLDHLKGADAKTIFVMELSSHQLEDIRYSPHIAIILDIVPEHMDYYVDFAHYVGAKSNIVKYQLRHDIAIFNPTHPIVARIALSSESKKLRFSLSRKPGLSCWVENGNIVTRVASGTPDSILDIRHIPLLGGANVENILAAVTVGLALNIPKEKISKAVMSFKPLEHRLEYVGTYHGIKFYNDSLATIPEATIHALQALAPNVYTLIAGGYDRKLDYTILGKALAASSVKNLILFPDTGVKIETALKLANPQTDIVITHVQSMDEAVRKAYALTPSGKICILSPAAASFNLFKDYKDRGETFKKAVLMYQ